MNDVRLLLTGGTGFIGRSLLRHWWLSPERRPRHVVVISRDPSAFQRAYPTLASAPWLELRVGEILDPKSLPTDRFDQVIHAAAESTRGPALSPMQRFVQIVDGTRNTLRMSITAGVKRYLYLSSGAVYGSLSAEQNDPHESDTRGPDPLDINQAYGVAKRTAEHLCCLAAKENGLEVVIARCFTYIGQDLPMDAHFAIGNFIRDALWGRSIFIAGDGTPVRSYMDQRDLAYWLTELLNHAPSGQAFNVGAEESLSIRELAELVRQTVAPGKEIVMQLAPKTELRRRYVPSTVKARSDLGLRLQFGLQQSIIDTARAWTASYKCRP